MTHRDLARKVAGELGIEPLAWAAQAVTYSYEHARGLRVVGQRGDRLAAVSPAAATGDPASWAIPAEVVRTLVLVTVVAGLVAETGADGWWGGVVLGLALWVGFALVLWAGAVVHERTPWKLAAIHAGDWLVKLPVVAALVAVVQ